METTVEQLLLNRPVEGHNIVDGSTLADVIGGATTVLVFLRHHG